MQRSEQLWWIARLAAAGQCTGLAAAMADAAADRQWHAYARCAAVIAVGKLAGDDIVNGLSRILDQGDNDPDHEVRAAIIDILYPKLMTTQALVAALRPQSALFGGGYYRTLGELADRIPPTDLPVVLDWLGQVDDQSEARGYDELVEGLLQHAWEHCDNRAIRRALARLLVSANWRLLAWKRRSFPWLEGEADRRRSLILEMAGMGADGWQAILLTVLLRPDDAEWILDEIVTCPPSAAISLAECLARIVPPRDMTAAFADRVLSLQPDHPAHEATRFLRGATDISSGIGKLQHEQAIAEHEAANARAQVKEQAKVALNHALTHVDADPESWWQIHPLMHQTSEGDPIPSFVHDLTASPGWNELQPDDATKVIDTGLRYLEVHTPNPAVWTPLTSWTINQVLPDWTGVYLLTTLVRHYPDKLSEVQPDVWRRWMSAIVAVPVFAGSDPDDLRVFLLDALPSELRPTLADEVMNHLKALHDAGQHLSVGDIYERLVLELADRMVAWLLAVPQTSPAADELQSLIVRSNATETALDLCRQLRNDPDSPLAARAGELLPALDPNSAVDELTAKDHSLAQVAAVASRIDSTKLDQDHVFSAARLLLDTFPYHTDPPMRSGAVTPADQARMLRQDLLQQLASAGRVDDLFALLADRSGSDREILGRYLATARARQADLAVKTISPQSLLDLLRSADARLVRDDADFQTVILHQLDNMQRHLVHTTAFREIWDRNIPQSEDSITDWVQRRLEERLLEGVVVDREIQVKREKPQGVGTRIDCVATTVTETRSTARVLFEAKLANNPQVLTAMRAQLIDFYLVPQGRRHGIMLIYWIHPDSRPQQGWPKKLHPDREALQATLQEQADAELMNGFHITPVILDITPPQGFAGKDANTPTLDGITDPDSVEPDGP